MNQTDSCVQCVLANTFLTFPVSSEQERCWLLVRTEQVNLVGLTLTICQVSFSSPQGRKNGSSSPRSESYPLLPLPCSSSWAFGRQVDVVSHVRAVFFTGLLDQLLIFSGRTLGTRKSKALPATWPPFALTT